MVKANLYDLLAGFISMKQIRILAQIEKSKLLNFLIIDYDKFDDNSNVLLILNKVVKIIINCKEDGYALRNKLLQNH